MLCINGDNCFKVLDNPKLIEEIANIYGEQCIVVSIDYNCFFVLFI